MNPKPSIVARFARAALLAVVLVGPIGASGVAACSGPAHLRPELASAATSALALSDALEDLIAKGQDTDDDRDAAYDLVRTLPADNAGDAFGHAAIAGRSAEKKGVTSLFSTDKNPTSLVGEAEKYARMSRDMDPNFRDGAATRMLGSLYVLAPADMVKHGNSEDGISMLEDLAKQHPDVPQNQLRLAEAYIALGDKDSARDPLCKSVAMRSSFRRDDQALLDKLVDQMKPFQCPAAPPPSTSAASAAPPPEMH